MRCETRFQGVHLIYQFADYSLDVERQELRRGAELVQGEPQVLDLLQYVLRNRDRVASKDDLIAHVWKGRIVSESTLTSRIAAARQAIGDNGDAQRLIRTIARKGVRFVGDVREIQDKASAGVHGGGVTEPVQPLSERTSLAVFPFEAMA